MRPLWFVALLAACVKPGATDCPDGYVCPQGLVCATVAATNYCVDARQIGCIEDSPCLGDMGTCHENVCLPNRCGNNLVDTDEVCDDGNLVNDDTCSSTCASTNECGNGIVDPVKGEQCDSGVAGMSGDGCASTCVVEALAWRDVTPRGIGKRKSVAMAYDKDRQITVLFGGASTNTVHGDTLVFKNESWIPVDTGPGPEPRYLATMAYDEMRDQIVLFGGAGLSKLDDTWTFDGATWTQQQPATRPPVRSQAAMAYHAGRGEIVLFGGHDGSMFLSDTWLWDGTNWTQYTGLVHPPPDVGRMAYDEVGGVVVWYGTSQTWLWNGSWTNATGIAAPPTDTDFMTMSWSSSHNGIIALGHGPSGNTWKWTSAGGWVALSPPTRPLVAADAVMADGESGPLVFGGEFSPSGLSDSTYRWTDAWNELPSIPSSPVPRGGHAMTYDSRHGEIVLYGGVDAKAVVMADTWRWSNGTWRLEPAGGVVQNQRAFHSMAYDSVRDRAVIFGGSSNAVGYSSPGTAFLGDTLEWVDDHWQDRAVVGPEARRLAAMAFDEARGLVVLFGGGTKVGNSLVYKNDTWTWNGTQWTKLSPLAAPPARDGAAIAYDPIRERIVLFGGAAQFSPLTAHGDTWEWDGTNWTQKQPAVSPPARVQATMSFDPGRQTIVLAGGRGTAGGLDDLWEWDGTAWTQLVPTGNPGAVITAAYDNVGRRLITYGDENPISVQDTTRALEYSTPIVSRERCLVGTADEDGDGLAGCADPDCWARCTPLCPPGKATCSMAAPRCGNGVCDPLEDPALCPADCN